MDVPQPPHKQTHICEICASDLNFSALFDEPEDASIMRFVPMVNTVLIFLTMLMVFFFAK